eukprot:m.52147 g.52147  ORF g.52147 m.52147 type:complete len:395 (-) comp13045_c0_seq1:568-1752(-)
MMNMRQGLLLGLAGLMMLAVLALVASSRDSANVELGLAQGEDASGSTISRHGRSMLDIQEEEAAAGQRTAAAGARVRSEPMQPEPMDAMGMQLEMDEPLPAGLEEARQQNWVDEDSLINNAAAVRPRIAIISLFAGSHASFADYARKNKMQYAARHGYDFIDVGEEAFMAALGAEAPEDMLFHKIPALLHYLPLYDWVFWSDADALFVNQSIPLEWFIDVRADVIFPAGPPSNKRYSGFINSGHFLIRDSEWTTEFLQATWNLKSAPCDIAVNKSALLNGWWNVCLKSGRCCEMGEQSAFMILLADNPAWLPHVKYVGFRDFNSLYPYYGEGDLVVHFAGIPNQERLQLMKTFVAAIESGVDPLPIPDAMQPQFNRDHVVGIDYSALNTRLGNY